ncbi:hypothetical protein [Paenibacillus sp. UMB4589-SE434]|uniref:hypothetical protein n=1 Tax=Paenibacillus sp. UMB4589-SE434 TaxID=3046314 RepID=UPI0025508DBE|nr:hypothetical protein [Paenibacillus sp. UMB4589-SE434]MDK8179735.1 hypothetical protein [Paenibacillus sp. UMB4589-SE434]
MPQLNNLIRIGFVFSVHPEKAAVRVVFNDQPNQVSGYLPVIVQHSTYSLPVVNDNVLCLYLTDADEGFCLGTYHVTNDELPTLSDAFRSVWLKNATVDRSLSMRESGDLSEQSKYHFAVLTGIRGGVEYTELWILVNAWYDYTTQRFKRFNVNNFSFGWQFQGGGTYPGEELIGDSMNQGISLWKANGKKAYAEGDPMRDQTGLDIGAPDEQGGWREFGITLGWNNVFMCDSYGGMTIGGSGLEIDGSGISPFKRVSLGKFSGGSVNPDRAYKDYGYAYNGTMWNTQHGMWNMDENKYNSYYWGMVSPLDFYDTGTYNPGSNRALLDNTKWVWRMLNKNKEPKVENWIDVFEISQTGDAKLLGKPVAAIQVVRADIVNVTDFNMSYPDATWGKHNTLIVAVKGVLKDGTVKQLGAINATYTDYGLYGYLGQGFASAQVFISKY